MKWKSFGFQVVKEFSSKRFYSPMLKMHIVSKGERKTEFVHLRQNNLFICTYFLLSHIFKFVITGFSCNIVGLSVLIPVQVQCPLRVKEQLVVIVRGNLYGVPFLEETALGHVQAHDVLLPLGR